MTGAAFDTLATARDLEAAGAGHEELATKTDIANLRADLAALEARMHRALWMQAGAIVAAVVALVKLLP